MAHATLIEQMNPENSSRPNNEIAMVAERRFRSSPCLALRVVTCGFQDGALILRGQVSSFYLKQLAQETVRALKEVGVIHNTVEVIRGTDSASHELLFR